MPRSSALKPLTILCAGSRVIARVNSYESSVNISSPFWSAQIRGTVYLFTLIPGIVSKIGILSPDFILGRKLAELTLQQANKLILEVLNTAREKEMPPIAVAVLDSGAHLKAFQREDGVSFLRVQIAQAKAWGALAMACNTDQLAERYNQDTLQQGFINALNGMTDGKIIPLPGGVLVRNDKNEIIGAVGAAGGLSTDDEACVNTALKSQGFKLSEN